MILKYMEIIGCMSAHDKNVYCVYEVYEVMVYREMWMMNWWSYFWRLMVIFMCRYLFVTKGECSNCAFFPIHDGRGVLKWYFSSHSWWKKSAPMENNWMGGEWYMFIVSDWMISALPGVWMMYEYMFMTSSIRMWLFVTSDI